MTPPAPATTRLFIDADACPVKDEVYRVAERYGLQVFVVSNGWINTRRAPWIEQVVVDAGPDIADDWIAERAVTGDIVITSDIPLADRCLKAGAQALKPNGQPFTPDSIGSALAGRLVGEHMRSMGLPTSGPPPFGPKDRSAFLQALDTAVVRARREVS
ncbi:YaiI/YqxD family protein [uncultured Brevundimonas sp.]|uniref:YaiI/YqxD family protein n=1 Tax=uncultured Brevundimonas sp. TaxID=213418 RepID=UPI0030ED931B|tara:strand:+ start:72784 stop:73260 length:477 start_codon:yes stop_codon:yes gene_type:complete